MNAQIGLTNPAACGGDVCHLNLHKTFAMCVFWVLARLSVFMYVALTEAEDLVLDPSALQSTSPHSCRPTQLLQLVALLQLMPYPPRHSVALRFSLYLGHTSRCSEAADSPIRRKSLCSTQITWLTDYAITTRFAIRISMDGWLMSCLLTYPSSRSLRD